MNHNHQIYHDRRCGDPEADARPDRRRARPRADRGRMAAQPRFPATRSGTTATSITYPGFRNRRPSWRSSPAPTATGTSVLQGKERGARDLGRLSLRARRRARNLRLRRGASDLGARPDAAGSRGRPARAVHAAGTVPGMGPEDHRPAQRSPRPRAHGRQRARGDRRRAAGARRAAPREGRARARADAPRRGDLGRRAPARDGPHPRRLARVPGRSRARARVPALRRAGGRVSVDRRRRPQRVRAALPRQQPAAAGRRAAADRRRLRIPGLRVGHHAHVSRSTAGSPGPQKAVYELVLAAQQACLDAVRPGAEFHDYHEVAERVLAQGYIDLGLCRGTLDEVLESGSLQAVLHAPRRPLARAWTCTTPASTR